MMEKAHACEGHGDTVLVASFNHIIVADRTTSLSDILYTALVGALDIVAKGEEGIATQSHLHVLCEPGFLFVFRQRLGLFLEELLPGTLAQYIVVILRDIHIDGVIAIGTTNLVDERQVHHFRMLAQPPDIGLVTSQTGTVNTALLTSTDTNGLTILYVAYRVTLGVLQGDEGDNQVALCLWGESLVLCGDRAYSRRGHRCRA